MDAHADIDENTLKDEGVLKCPRNGHVLYMQINNNSLDIANGNSPAESLEEMRRMGPTVIFPSRKVAWGSVSPRTLPSQSLASYNSIVNLEERVQEYIVDVENYWDDEQRLQYGYHNDDERGNDEMAIVPAINGRLLRFDGRAFHSVPRPPDRYLLGEDEIAAFLEKDEEEDCDDEEYWDDEYEDEEGGEEEKLANQRSVLLFNTWPEGSCGPRGVFPDRIVADIPDGIAIEDEDDASASPKEDERWQKWQNAYGENFEKVWCNPIEEWTEVEVEQPTLAECRDVTIPLMGNPARRGCTLTKAAMTGPIENCLFHDSHKVSLVTLKRGDVE
jgi:hypothetical protein